MGIFETLRVEDGRVRLLERHLARLRRAGVPEELVGSAARIVEAASAHGDAPVVLRLDVLACRVAVTPRAAPEALPVRLVTVEGYDPHDRGRERKSADRRWAEQALVAARTWGGDEALLVSADGLVGEATRANVFALTADGTLVTPPAAGLLPGVTRSWVLEQPGALERPLALDELRSARAVFLTTAARGVVAVAALGGRALPSDPAVAALAAAWRGL